jgi:TolA-binding protein
LSQKIALVQLRVERQQAQVVSSAGYFTRMKRLDQARAICMSVEDFKAAQQRLTLEEAKLAELKAELAQLRKVALRQDLLGPDHPATLGSLPDVATVYEQANRWADAEDVYKELAVLQRRKGPAAGPELATVARLCRCLLHQKKYAEAEVFLREGLGARPKEQPDDWLLDETRGLLGESLLGQQKYADAEPLLLQACKGLKTRQGKVRLTESLERLVRLYEGWGKEDDADAWRRQLHAHRQAQKRPNRLKEQ